MTSFPVAHDLTRRIVNVHWRTGESPPGVFGVRIHGITPSGGNGSTMTVFPHDGHQSLPSSQVSLTSPYPPGENPSQVIAGTIGGSPGGQSTLPNYVISQAFIASDLTLGVLMHDSGEPPGPNVTLFFDMSGYSFTSDAVPSAGKAFVAHHLYIDTLSAISALSLAMGPA